jgi:hypothetical protein
LPVKPILECVVQLGTADFVAYFGYENPNDWTVTIEVGADNRFPQPANVGQPTSFAPGRSPAYPDAAFGVRFDGAIVWQLDGQTVVASPGSPRCP